MKNPIYFLLILLITIASCKKEASKPTIIFQDNLVTDNHTWPSDTNGAVIRNFDSGHYSIRIDSQEIIGYSLAPYANINFPYTIQVDATTLLDNTAQWGSTGIVFNYADHNDYDVAEIWQNGTYRIWIRVSGSIYTVVNFTYNSAIHTNALNTIKVVQNQSNMELVVNGVSLGTFNITLPSSLVQAGPATSTAGPPDFTPATGQFNNFSIAKN